MTKKKTTQKSSPNHRSSDKYSKDRSSRKGGAKEPEAGMCCIEDFDDQLVLRTLQRGETLDQNNIVVCPAGHEHEIDIAPLIAKLLEAGHSIAERVQIRETNCPPNLGKGKAIYMTCVYSYIDTTRSAANG